MVNNDQDQIVSIFTNIIRNDGNRIDCSILLYFTVKNIYWLSTFGIFIFYFASKSILKKLSISFSFGRFGGEGGGTLRLEKHFFDCLQYFGGNWTNNSLGGIPLGLVTPV